MGSSAVVHTGTGAVAQEAFFDKTPIAKPVVSGSRGTSVALANLLTALANLGLITDSTIA